MDQKEIAEWIRRKDDCSGFQDMARAVEQGEWEEAKKLAARYRPWFSEYEVERFTAFGLL